MAATLSLLSATNCASNDGSSSAEQSADSLTEAPHWKVLNFRWEAQTTGYWCGPTATRIALSTRMANPPSQAALAKQLRTTTNGTDSITQVRDGLNGNLDGSPYEATVMPNDPPTADQKARFWNAIVTSIDQGFPLVTNIVAPPSNHPPGYPNTTIYHYFTVVGYNPDTREAYIADPANFGGHGVYWLKFDQLATLVPPKGYASLPAGPGGGVRCDGGSNTVGGAIAAQYQALGGCASVLGPPITNETATPDTIGRYNVFEKGSIYWTPDTGAHEVLGTIRDKWKEEGWEAGRLGYPTSGEYDVPGGRKSDFQHGSISWVAATNIATVAMKL